MSLIADIKKHEGYSKTAYSDTLGKLTIGIGFLVEALELDEDICDMILERKLITNECILQRKLKWYDDQPQEIKNILQNMFYQLHYKLFDFKKTLSYIKSGKYTAGSIEMLDSLWAKQAPNRAKELSERLVKVEG